MTISINRTGTDRLLELGGGSHPLVHPECRGGRDVHVDFRMCNNGDGSQAVDIVWDLSQTPWPLKDQEFDGAIAVFVLEHLPYPQVPGFVRELFRVLKPGAKAVVAIPNTEAQLKWTLEHPEGWDGKNLFESASCKLFGDQQHSEREGDPQPGSDSHKSFFSPAIVTQLFQEAGFSSLVVRPYGERATDLLVEAIKPPGVPWEEDPGDCPKCGLSRNKRHYECECSPGPPKTTQEDRTGEKGGETLSEGRSSLLEAARPLEMGARDLETLYGRDYWENYRGEGFAWDFPRHEILYKNILRRKPESVLELGCGRGYLLKRFQDAGIRAAGLDVSRTAWQTRVCESISLADILATPWTFESHFTESFSHKAFDICLSVAFLEHVPEHLVPSVAEEMVRTCKRGLHAVHLQDDGKQHGACTFRDRSWWQDKLPPGHEVVSWDEMVQGEFPQEVLQGDGKIKANLGCAWTMRHHGWENIDVLDLKQFSQANGYKFRQWDLKTGLPWKTGEVDLFFLSHVLEHLSYQDGLRLLKECRRCAKPETGAIRVIVPDAGMLLNSYVSDHRPGLMQGCTDELLRDAGVTFLKDFDLINPNAAASPLACQKLWHLLLDGHASIYDQESLSCALTEAGWVPSEASFRLTKVPAIQQVLREGVEMLYAGSDGRTGVSLFVDAVPLTG